MANKKNTRGGLGKGLDLLLPTATAEDEVKAAVSLKTSELEPNKEQPRKRFDEEAIEELTESVKRYGIIEPIVVTKKDGYYQIVAGERRWRAAKKAKLKEVPVIIKDYSDREIAEISLIENIQREDLNPIEEAQSYKKLIDDYKLTQEQLAERVSKSRTAISNTMRLLKLHKSVQKMLISGELSAGHARALLGLESQADQAKAAERIVADNLSVRQAEDLVKEMNSGKATRSKSKPVRDEYGFLYKDLEKKLSESLGTKVKISRKDKGKGKIEISYYSDDELDRIYGVINRGAK